jgi:hypothetical protein
MKPPRIRHYAMMGDERTFVPTRVRNPVRSRQTVVAGDSPRTRTMRTADSGPPVA